MRCEAVIMQYDDRWGGIKDRCELEVGHDGLHRVSRDACSPVGWLSWEGSYEP